MPHVFPACTFQLTAAVEDWFPSFLLNNVVMVDHTSAEKKFLHYRGRREFRI